MTLEDKTAIVTGGTGALGSAVVQAFLSAGAHVDVPFREEGALEKLRRELPAGGAALSGGTLDLTDEEAVTAYVAEVARNHDGIDILVNAAGSFAGGKPVHESPWSVWQRMLDSNLKTAVLASRAAVPHILRRGGGAIVHVSSRPATEPAAGLAAYAASKRALLALTDAMAAELRDANVTVNAILPATIDTAANRGSIPGADYTTWVRPGEIARVILFLAGPDARMVSGAHVPVYGRA